MHKNVKQSQSERIKDNETNEENYLVIERNAVQIFRPVEQRQKKPENIPKKRKMPHTNVSKLIYVAPTPKNTPTKTKVKSVHQYVNKNPRKIFDNDYQDESNILTQKQENGKVSKTHFLKKKQEREKDIEEINQILEQINPKQELPKESIKTTSVIVETTLPQSSVQGISNDVKNDDKPQRNDFKPSKSNDDKTKENNYKFVPGSTLGASKSAISHRENQIEIKKKTYNSEDAKLFIKQQKEKWKSDEHGKTNLENKSKNDKEEIKKRLQELHKNTIKILESNIKKNKKNTAQPNQDSQKKDGLTKTGRLHKSDTNIAKSYQPHSNRILQLNKEKKAKNQPVEETASAEEVTNYLTSTNNRIGLLRKSNSDENSFSNVKDYDIKKENKILESLVTPKLNLTSNRIPNKASSTVSHKVSSSEYKDKQKSDDKCLQIKNQNHINIEANLGSEHELRSKDTKQNLIDYDTNTINLQIPKAKLKSHVLSSKTKKSMQSKISEKTHKENIPNEDRSNKSDDIPHWLKPSQMDIYPYNFITAVRKKLEALTNPVAQRSNVERTYQQQSDKKSKNTYQETPFGRSKSENENIRRRLIENSNLNTSFESRSESQTKLESTARNEPDIMNSIKETNEPIAHEKSHSLECQKSEMLSNFSSVSIHVPESNSRQKKFLSSTKNQSNMHHEENDDTTISSSIFSSPEKKRTNDASKLQSNREGSYLFAGEAKSLSPLSLENITNLHIKSKKQDGSVDQLTVPKSNLVSNSKSNRENSDRTVTSKVSSITKLDQLLEDFNKSLSHAIEVNNQLKTALDHSPKVYNPHSKQNTLEILNNETSMLPRQSTSTFFTALDYTSDFEEDLSNTTLTQAQSQCDNNDSKDQAITEDKNESEQNIVIETDIENPSKAEQMTTHSQSKSDSGSKGSVRSKSKIPQSVRTNTEVAESTIKESVKNSTQNDNNEENKVDPIKLEEEVKEDSHQLNGKLNFIRNHINTSRGNDKSIHTNHSIISINQTTTNKSSGPLPFYAAEKQVETSKQLINSSVGSEFIAVYNKSDIEVSMFLQEENQSVASETTLNYSTIGVYEQLLQAENLKSDQLTSLLKIREKVLIDRTKGQIAWLEVQKEKYKSKGLSEQISAIKKKQRAILLKMEREREEIKRLMNNQQQGANHSARSKNHSQHPSLLAKYQPKLSKSVSNITIRKGFTAHLNQSQTSSKIVRGFDIKGTSPNLEQILQKREEELHRRRQHVEHLMAWHQRLDKEEDEVFELEQMLLECNRNKWHITSPAQSNRLRTLESPALIVSEGELQKEKKIAEIEKSLRELQNISVCSNDNPNAIDHVRISGHKLNRLWSRLTGQKLNKFDPHKKYRLTKDDLEKFYERAKEKVIEEFKKEQNLGNLLEQSSVDKISNVDNSIVEQQTGNAVTLLNTIDIPSLHLNFSSESDIGRTLASSRVEPSVDNLKDTNISANMNAIELDDSADKSKEKTGSNESQMANDFKQDSLEVEAVADDTQNKFDLDQSLKSNKSLSENGQNKSYDTTTNFETNDELHKNDESLSSELKPLTSLDTEMELEDSLSENSSTPSNTGSHTFLVKNISPRENTSQEAISEVLELSLGEAIPMQFPSDKSKSKYSRPSVIIPSSNLNDDGENKTPETKSETIESVFGKTASIATEVKDTSKSASTIISIPKAETRLTEQKSDSVEEAIEGSINSIKPASSISSENMPAPNSNSSENSVALIIKSEESSALVQSLILDIPTQTMKPATFNTPSAAKSLDKTADYSYEYENDFSMSEITNLEDISMPKFETTFDTTKTSAMPEEIRSAKNADSNSLNYTEDSFETASNTTDLEKRLIDLDGSLKDLSNTIERVLSPDKESSLISDFSVDTYSASIHTISLTSSASSTIDALKLQRNNSAVEGVEEQSTAGTAVISNEFEKITLMPDIINEVEFRRRQQILIESEIKQLEHAIPYVFREIPNKPPPPYVPPAHGSPMTTIFPSEARIKEITFRRTAEIFEELLPPQNDSSPADSPAPTAAKGSILNENITNIYERMILDICKECMQEYRETMQEPKPDSYKNPLALYNPPDRLSCMQEFIYRRVRKLLAMEKKYNRKNSIFSIGRKKRDHVDEILIQELYEEEFKWTNFDEEEDEVKISIVDEILNGVITDVVSETVRRSQTDEMKGAASEST